VISKRDYMNLLPRLLQLPTHRHLFLFGARNTGKSTLIEQSYQPHETFYFDLLDQDLEQQLQARPNILYEMVKALPSHQPYIVIDEIQKIPDLLNVVQRLMKDKDRYFIMSGSSAKKLKQEGVNLLAGRAFVYHLYPLTAVEMGNYFNLDQALQWGTLPEILGCFNDDDRKTFLMSYAHTYLKEEIAMEQFVRQLAPFRRFLEVAAQCNGQIINYANIARDVQVDDKTIKSYFSLLEDTLIGYMLEPYHGSLRKRIHQKQKFYFFDTGVVRALARFLDIPLLPSTSAYGKAFEHFIINECIRLSSYYKKDYQFSYLRTVTDLEIDLIIERPGQTTLLIEIKSTREVTEPMLKTLRLLKNDFPNAETLCLSNDPFAKQFSERSYHFLKGSSRFSLSQNTNDLGVQIKPYVLRGQVH